MPLFYELDRGQVERTAATQRVLKRLGFVRLGQTAQRVEPARFATLSEAHLRQLNPPSCCE